uniref:NADH-ubiquinone oxidoreductase chain 5 n=1 Tax=Livia junci TaxID=1449964 RepID=A0A344A2J0_9HEMI|nr:NADH dehydrogenase subunit 5 [Livia junci]AWU48981.1 NADH dehydrogenase subunit 5 [Livia junci]
MKLTSKYYFISMFMLLLCFAKMMFLLMILIESKTIMLEIELFFFNSISISFIFYIDKMSLIFSFTVLFISSFVLMYSESYMGKECHRFLWKTLFFIFFMLVMIYSPSILGVILGWDGLGIVSYCLIIYYQSKDSFNSGFITAASNRLGDTMLILSIISCMMNSGLFMFWENFSWLSLFFFVGACMTKSAQFPFSAWLPAAMAAPTPISSLVHSSTLVTAGVYMMVRFFPSFEENLNILWMTMIISLMTIFIAGLSSLQEMDLKKVIALSTLGQLGFMMVTLSLGYPQISFFHLLIHAMFKALLFMCAGSIIHSSMGIQDLRKMGSLNINLTIKWCLLMSSFSLMGIPFSSGFYSKDMLLEMIMCSYGGAGMGIMMLIGALITIIYTLRSLIYLSMSNYWVLWEEPKNGISIPIFIMGTVSIIFGSCLNWLLMSNLNFECLSYLMKWMPFIMIMLGLMSYGILTSKTMLKMLTSMFFISSLTNMVSVILVKFFYWLKIMDQGWMEMILLIHKSLLMDNSSSLKKLILGGKNYFFVMGSVLIILILI